MSDALTRDNFASRLAALLETDYETRPDSATADEVYRAAATLVRGEASRRHKRFRARAYAQGAKQVYYLCMEFLMGRSLKTNLFNLGLADTAQQAFAELGLPPDEVYGREPDAGLGNGGLGRLAACYLDAMATRGYPATGYCILYEYGIFRQKLADGWQAETPDDWLPGGGVWLKAHPDRGVEVRFGGEVTEHWDGSYHYVEHHGYESVQAVPYDMYVPGFDSQGVSKLRLWSAKGPGFDMSSFNRGDFAGAVKSQSSAELISKVLYPNDNNREGKILRLKQQYFLSAASVADILREHIAQYGSVDTLADKAAIQLNDTHPTLAVLEMLRLLLDECGYTWDAALALCGRLFAYTNHTVLPEALEQWDEDIFRATLPRVYTLAREVDKTARKAFAAAFPGDEGKIEYMAPIGNGRVRMANICAFICHSINGVSALHSEIIKKSVFADYALWRPGKFTNVTNGIAWRRWLLAANPALTKLIESAVGPEVEGDARRLSGLAAYADDPAFLDSLSAVKAENKARLAAALPHAAIDPASLFDTQAKRMHEYKRQHMNALSVLADYISLKDDPGALAVPRTYLFAGKAAPGYYLAKQMIRFIWAVGRLIDGDDAVKGRLKVVFLENYSVTLSELLMPATEISQQISLAGTEASGTGNMKFMLNGAVTLGTLDGANIEIRQAAGAENFIHFGMDAKQAAQRQAAGYSPRDAALADPLLARALAMVEKGFLGESFPELAHSLLDTDPYMVLADFADYRRARQDAAALWADKRAFARAGLMNIAGAGRFSADRAVDEYAGNIWGVGRV